MKRIGTLAAAALCVVSATSSAGQAKPAAPVSAAQTPAAKAPAAQAPAAVTPPSDYVIGAGDVLIITYWEEPAMSTDAAIVRPDGKVTLPLLNDVDALGMKPEQLGVRLTELSSKMAGLKDPRVTVTVRAINSRKVYIWGGISKPGAFDLLTPMNVMQLISIAGGPKEFVNGEKIVIIREEGGKQRPIKFNLKEVQQGLKLEQNIPLKPGDIISVPE